MLIVDLTATMTCTRRCGPCNLKHRSLELPVVICHFRFPTFASTSSYHRPILRNSRHPAWDKTSLAMHQQAVM